MLDPALSAYQTAHTLPNLPESVTLILDSDFTTHFIPSPWLKDSTTTGFLSPFFVLPSSLSPLSRRRRQDLQELGRTSGDSSPQLC